MTVVVGWGLAAALVLLVALAAVASHRRLGLAREQVIAAVRAVAQLALVSGIATLAVSSIAGGTAFALFMLAVAVWTTTGRVDVRHSWPWTTLALLAGIVPVLGIVFVTGASPVNGITIVSLGGIVTGNMMSAHTLAGRRVFAELESTMPQYEAALALGLPRPDAIGLLTDRVLSEALLPNLDQTRTVGLVTLPGTYIGVLLGGGSPLAAGATQVLVLVGIMAGQAVTVTTMGALVRRGLIMPRTLAARLHH